ncbi:MAG: HAD-IB family phosphatase [Deltaproteobacteria bacterium]|nr:HAD-IB family phosphatase [Deltaproteobacteria bacterium]
MSEKSRIISLSAVGLDSRGLVSKITTRISKMKGNIIDVEESCRRGLFSIFLIVDFSLSELPVDDLLGALKALEKETGLKVVADICEGEEITPPPEKEHHVVTILGMDKPGVIAAVSTLLHRHGVNIENCRMIARGDVFSMEMVIDTSRIPVDPQLSRVESIDRMKTDLKDLCSKIGMSVVIQSEDIYNRSKKLIVFDVESTLISPSSLADFLEKVAGGAEKGPGVPAFGAGGEEELRALREGASSLKDIPLRDLESLSGILRLNPGSLELIGVLKSMGFKIALISSGFNFFLKKMFEGAGIDYAFSNALRVDEKGFLTGELEEPAITAETKKEILDLIMSAERIGPDQVIAIGDGSTRSHFIKDVGLSIAFKPTPEGVDTDGILSSDRIMSMLYCLGIPKRELEKYVKE